MTSVTIKDVAALAGVSLGTASRVLSGHPATSSESRARVTAAAEQLDFRPNAQARSLRSTKTNVLGLLVSDVRNPFFADLAHAVEQAALEAGYVILLGNANELEDQQNRFLDTLIDQRVDGVIVAPQGDGKGSISSFLNRGIPTVFVDRTVSGVDVPSVTTDSRPGISQAVQHLSEQGHRRIGYIAGPQSISTGRERYSAFVEALRGTSLDQDPDLTVFGDFQLASGASATQQLLQLEDPPTAILAADSPMAVGSVSKLHELGIQIGQDVALVAFDNINWFALLNPALSVIAHSVEDMGRTSVDLLLRVIGGEAPASITLPSELIVRKSSSHRLSDTMTTQRKN
ncbi:LacI family DNA-binding transcriptional regulator [Pseudarthrobacter sp. J75]|uniref:LacI family DNA-binding transcriptional regulator n=1 Tax=unclassified Pseudarthrobacter TaxID=2647000 RepID=UPI002E823F58|nr:MULTISPECIES: LacI family DNA-binding transcriptional regulator [unclassified Pseudarthrobacter]MEE2524587.1 LacI family DNA-binding transcriptional regulator [Pseudarthrobacter sp. J47]MEE2527584.1 LacI family DNA-binding transcriptional regulator [Pseudarthrobacter sp. J75]